ncbi:MAG: protein kinase [Phycisphaerae bacterium]|nr:protein kinase [Phycisphaerae bacterium]
MRSSQDENLIATCPGCGRRYRLAKALLGRLVKCKHCQTQWKVTANENQGSTADLSELSGTNLGGGNPQPKNANAAPLEATQPLETKANLNSSSIDEDFSWEGRKLGRFEIIETLGQGAMGVVFRAHDPDLKRDVALKILAKQFIRSQKKTYRLEQFIREARSAARLSHPYTVTVYEIGQDQGWFFIAMELVEGKTLLDLVMKKRKRVPMEQVCELVAEAAEALSAAHKLGIVHRDIKPSNLMLTKDGRIKVADFGLAQLAEDGDDFELPTKAVGTPYWMSPEQCKGQTAIPQSDVYSLGAVLFFALTGEVPFKGKTKQEILKQHVNSPVPDPRSYRKEVSDGLVRIIRRAMAKNPAERFQDAAEMAIGLRQIGHGLQQSKLAERWWGQLASTGSMPLQNQQTARRGKSIFSMVMAFAILIALTAIAVGLWYEWDSKRGSGINNAAHHSSVTDVPVYVIKGQRLYHAAGCPMLNEVPQSQIVIFPSDQAAEEQGNTTCRYCESILKLQKEKAAELAEDQGTTPETTVGAK